MIESGEDLFDEMLVHISAWRRLRYALYQTAKVKPEYKDMSEKMLLIMDQCYEYALADLKKQKESMEHSLEKIRKNARYGKVD